MALINLTHRAIQIGPQTLPPSGTVATVQFRTLPADPIENIPTYVCVRTPQNLPDPVPGTYLIVSEDVARAAEYQHRSTSDLLVPGNTGLLRQ
jgi:hypothetical protein